MKQCESDNPTDPRDGGREDRCCQQAENVAQPVEAEIRTEVVLNNARCENSLPGIAEGKNDRAPEIPVSQQVGRDGGADRAGHHRQSRGGPKRNQDAGRNPGGGPEHGHAIRFGQQDKAQPRGEKISDADRDREPDQTNPPLRQVSGDKPAARFAYLVQQVVPSIMSRQY